MVGIRADANEVIASGHIMRCMAIAAQLVKMGIGVKFYISDEYPVRLLQSRGFEYHVLGNDWKNKCDEADELGRLLSKDEITLLLVDSYEADSGYFAKLHRYVKLAYMDDLCRFACDADILINYAVQDCDRIYKDFKWVQMPKLLTGLSYTPLREEFADINSKVCRDNTSAADSAFSAGEVKGTDRQENYVAQNIMITTGGSDKFGLTAQISQNILAAYENDDIKNGIKLHILEGAFFNDDIKSRLLALEKEYPQNIVIHRNQQHMENVLKGCQLAVSAAGTTLLEICACRVCCVCFAISDNQKPLLKYLKEQDAVYAVTNERDMKDLAGKAAQTVHMLIEAYNERNKAADRAGSIVDGHGAKRIAQAISGLLADA